MTTAPPAGPVAPPRAPAGLFVPSPTSSVRPEAPPLPPLRWIPLSVSALLAVALTVYVWSTHGAKPGVLLLLGLGLGIALFHSRFGFTSAWRQLVAVGNGSGLRAHALLLGTTATLFALIIGTGTGLFGTQPSASGGSLGVGLVLGSVLFAIGMQLGGACASGTLFAVGSGQTSVVLTLAGFIIGGTLSAWQYDLWKDLPAWQPVVLSDHIGWFGSWAVTIAVLLLVVWVSRRIQARRNPPPIGPVPSARGTAVRVLRGSWPTAVGALALAVLGAGVLLVSGGAWGVTSAFALWGSKLVGALGGQPENWTWWQQPGSSDMLAGSVLADKNSLTDIGIMIGAAVAAALGGSWVLHRNIPWRTAVAALLGGMLMGIGSRLAGGCNIGAYLSGIASGSLSGWLWGAFALAGTWVGLKARPLFRLGNPKPGDGIC
ncbi:YeeE/YedE family protein [Streptomyces sp. NPDC005776]|uniref:YeeE/YedE family protein n=1 Tax=Streptomyces sp. NPDC005776 TaxID=3154676 RepID=UPI0034056874